MIRIDVDGLDEVVRSLDAFAMEIRDLNAFKEVGEDVARDARAKAPKLSGRLANSIQVTNNMNEVEISSNLIYSGVQEWGGYHNIEGQHFMYKALANQNIEERVDENLDRTISLFGLN